MTDVTINKIEVRNVFKVFGNREKDVLALIREGRRVLYETTRADMTNFVLRNPVDLAREKRDNYFMQS